MKYFSKIRVAWLFIILLSATNITMLVFQLFYNQSSSVAHSQFPNHKNRHQRECMLKSELNLSKAQIISYDIIKENHHKKAMPIVDSLHLIRAVLMAELKNEKFDSVYAFSLVDKINQFNNALFSLSIVQYLEIDNILDSTQKLALSKVYCDMFGCSKNHRSCTSQKNADKGCPDHKGCE